MLSQRRSVFASICCFREAPVARDPGVTNVEISRRTAADVDELVGIYGRIFGDEKAARKQAAWRWQYEEAPGASAGPLVWVSRRHGRAVGQIGTMPVALWWGGREVRASWGIDYFVAPEAEGLGDSIALVKAWMQSVDVALVVGLAPTSYLICKRLGFRDLGLVSLFEAVLDPAAVARRRWGRVAGRVAAPLGAAFRLARVRRSVERDVQLQAAGEIGTEYDALWSHACGGFGVAVRRDAAYLRWRYRAAPLKRYELVEARRGGQLVGFVVTREENVRGDLRVGWIVDVFADLDDESVIDALVAHAMHRFAESGVAKAQAFAQHDRVAAALKRFGFFRGTSHARLCARPNGVPEDPIHRPGDWHIVFGDSDSDR